MVKNLTILGLLAIIVALPFILRQRPPQGNWKPGDPLLVIVSPHNEAIRYEFALAFSDWHQKKYGTPVKIDWRNIGGTAEISRYLASEYSAAAEAWWTGQGKAWPSTASDDLTKTAPPTDPKSADVWAAYRKTDIPSAISCGIDLFFGGGEFDHSGAFNAGFAVPCVDLLPPELFRQNGVDMIPEKYSGETWRTASLMGNVVSTFGIIFNYDRLSDLHPAHPPTQWTDLADFTYFGQVGLADPTKSSSTAKSFEMIVHQQIHDAVVKARYTDAQIADNEKRIAAYAKDKGKAYRRGDVPADLSTYQQAIEQGFMNGMVLLQEIGANARYFTDSGAKVPIDVSMGDAAVGMAIDFYGRFQAQASRSADGKEHMGYVTPVGGTSVSADPISLLRGAPSKTIALHFIEFILSDDGQRLWNTEPGQPGGPKKYALRRLPLRRTFYPSTQPWIDALAKQHDQNTADNLADPKLDPYEVGKNFTYYKRWTGDHFFAIRDVVRVMCMDSGDELKIAWKAVHARPDFASLQQPLGPMPVVKLANHDGKEVDVKIDWRNAPDIRKNFDALDVARAWVIAFRAQYAKIAAGQTVAGAGVTTGSAN